MNAEDRNKLAKAYIQDGVICKTKYMFRLRICRRNHEKAVELRNITRKITRSDALGVTSSYSYVEWYGRTAVRIINEILSSDLNDPKLDKLNIRMIMEF